VSGLVEVPCGGEVHTIEVVSDALRPLDHDFDDEATLAALGGTGSDCLALATALASIDDRTLLTIAWDSSPVLSRHAPAVLSLSMDDWRRHVVTLGRIPLGVTADSLRQRLAVAQRPSYARDAHVVALTSRWWNARRDLRARERLIDVVGPRFAWAVAQSLSGWDVAASHSLDVGLTDGADTIIFARMRGDRLDIRAFVAYSWARDVWAQGVDAEPGRLPLAGDGQGIAWNDAREGRRLRRVEATSTHPVTL
jgi:hypothetical protein